MLNCCFCFYILILLCSNIIGHSSEIFLKYFVRFFVVIGIFIMFS